MMLFHIFMRFLKPNIHDLHSLIDKNYLIYHLYKNKLPRFLFYLKLFKIYLLAEKECIYKDSNRIFLRRVPIVAFFLCCPFNTKHLGDKTLRTQSNANWFSDVSQKEILNILFQSAARSLTLHRTYLE